MELLKPAEEKEMMDQVLNDAEEAAFEGWRTSKGIG
jgi:hypothetical protein